MNKITTTGMRLHDLTRLAIFILFFSGSMFAQETYTTIRKNVNPLAYDLDHNLSNAQDSLLLNNKYLFKRVRFISDNAEKVFDFKPAVKTAKIPLDELPLGQYTVMFYQADKIIVFQIDRLLPFDTFDTIESDVAYTETEIVSEEIESIDLEYDAPKIAAGTNVIEADIEALEDHYIKSYNLSDMDRDYVQSRAEYRRNNLRPNGKPYND